MKVQLLVDGNVVLEGTGSVHSRVEGIIRLIVDDTTDQLYYVEYADEQFDEYLKYVKMVANLDFVAYPMTYDEWLKEEKKRHDRQSQNRT